MLDDIPAQSLRDMAYDPYLRKALDKMNLSKAQEFLILAMEYARKWSRLEDPWQAESILIDATLWMQEATKRIDKEVVNQLRRDERYKKGGVLI